MSRIDVSEIMHDTDFVDEMKLIKRVACVDNFGRNQITETCIDSIGSVQPATGEKIKRLPESMQTANVKSFWFQGKITASATGRYSDVMEFHGQKYLIQMVMDWSDWGAGWSEGLCIAQEIAP